GACDEATTPAGRPASGGRPCRIGRIPCARLDAAEGSATLGFPPLLRSACLTLALLLFAAVPAAAAPRAPKAFVIDGHGWGRGVVPWEMPHDWRADALRAQAVAARSYALATLKHGETFDVYADTRDQVYGGIRAETPQTNEAVGATAGQVLTWRGRVAITYYFSSSGGRTASSVDGLPWAPRVPYLVSVPDPYDSASPNHTWGPLV